MVRFRRDTATTDLFRDYQPAPVVERFAPEQVQGWSLAVRLSKAISATLKETSVPRDEIARAMSEVLNDEVSKTTLDAYASQAKEHSISAVRLAALVEVTGDARALNALLENTRRCCAAKRRANSRNAPSVKNRRPTQSGRQNDERPSHETHPRRPAGCLGAGRPDPLRGGALSRLRAGGRRHHRREDRAVTWLLGMAAGAAAWGLLLYGVHLLFLRSTRRRTAERAAFRRRVEQHVLRQRRWS